MTQRIRDWLHERHIRAVSRRWTAAMEAKDYADARRLSAELDKLRLARSPSQILRMEKRMGMHLRGYTKRTVMGLFVRRLVPAWAVRLMFRFFGLRNA